MPFPAAIPLLLFAAVADFNAEISRVAETGGGRVTVPAGVWEMRGPLVLKGGVELHLERGAELFFPDDFSLYSDALVSAQDAERVSVTGEGTFRTRAGGWHGAEGRKRPRPRFFRFSGCRKVLLDGFRIRESPNWTIHVRESEDVTIRNLDIVCHGANTDGIDLDSVDGALIENCRLDQGDDGFCMKSGKNAEGRRRGKPTRNVTIRNCTVVNAHTLLGIGSELSGGVENVTLENCTVEDTVWRVLFVKTNAARGGYARNITVRNVTAKRAKCTLFEIMTDYQWERRERKENPEIVRTKIGGIGISGVRCGDAWYVYDLHGDGELPVRGVSVADCEVKRLSRGIGRVENVEGFSAERVRGEAPPVAIWCDDADAIHRCGESAVFTVQAGDGFAGGPVRIAFENPGEAAPPPFEIDFATQKVFRASCTRRTPGYLRIVAEHGGGRAGCVAAFEPWRAAGGGPLGDLWELQLGKTEARRLTEWYGK